MDKIALTDLAVLYRVGVPDQERLKPQRLLITLEMQTDFTECIKNDDLTGTINYHEVMTRLLRFAEGREWKLIETLASDIAAMVLQEFRPHTVSVTIKKFILPELRHVSVSLTRPRST